jgi:integrase
MRLAEAAQTSKAAVIVQDGIQCLEVKDDAKTAASSSRVVPVAKTLLDRVDLLSIAVPASSAYEGREVGKRFGRLKSALGFGRPHVFHSIRKTAATVFVQAGISEGITADIVDHEKQTMTYGLYSGGTSIVQRKQAIDQFEVLMLRLE